MSEDKKFILIAIASVVYMAGQLLSGGLYEYKSTNGPDIWKANKITGEVSICGVAGSVFKCVSADK